MFRMLIPHETKPIETMGGCECLMLSRQVYEKKHLSQELRANLMFSEKIMLLKSNRLFDWPGGEDAKKKGAPK
jgi:hypothetical protein